MVNTRMNEYRNNHKPPYMAQRIIGWLLPEHLRECVLGDLQEEFMRRISHSPGRAAIWYWHQTMMSAIPLAIRLLHANRLSILTWMTFTAIITAGISLWDLYLAQTAAWRLASLVRLDGIDAIRAVYLIMQATGFFIGGCLIARTLTGRKSPRLFTAFVASMPVIVIAALSLNTDMQNFRLLQMLICLLAIQAGLRVIQSPKLKSA